MADAAVSSRQTTRTGKCDEEMELIEANATAACQRSHHPASGGGFHGMDDLRTDEIVCSFRILPVARAAGAKPIRDGDDLWRMTVTRGGGAEIGLL
jgi:hypothetical protein